MLQKIFSIIKDFCNTLLKYINILIKTPMTYLNVLCIRINLLYLTLSYGSILKFS